MVGNIYIKYGIYIVCYKGMFHRTLITEEYEKYVSFR